MPQEPSSSSTDSAVERLAAEVFERWEEEGQVDLEPYLARLARESDREKLRELVQGARNAGVRLSRRIRSGAMLAGRYKIEREIGTGGMGRVFAAHDSQLERDVAIKIMHSSDLGDREREQLFVRESRLLAALQHPGIVAVHEIGRDGDIAYIVMDLVDGTPLADVIAAAKQRQERSGGRKSALSGPLLDACIGKPAAAGRPSLIASSWYTSCAAILIEITRTIEAAHERGVVHRDLKPSNVLLLGGGTPVLLDFGLAGRREGSGGAVTEGFYGSVAYVAPEQATSMRIGADVKSDIYQLGLLLYELLTLQRAFAGSDLMQTLERIRQGNLAAPRRLNPSAPLELEAICMKAIEVAPERRYATAHELREDLQRFVEGLTPRALSTHRLRRAARITKSVVRRHPVTAGTLLAAVLAGTFMVCRAWWQSMQWSAPQIQFVRIDKNGEQRAVDDLSEVEAGDVLGAALTAMHPTRVYALSVFGGENDEQRLVAPLVAETYAEFLSGAHPEGPASRGRTLEEGQHLLACTSVDANARYAVEGVWLISCRDPDPLLEEWIDGIAKRVDPATFSEGVPLVPALAALGVEPPTMRGGSLADLSPAERAAVAERLRTALREERSSWLRDGRVRLDRVECRLKPPRGE